MADLNLKVNERHSIVPNIPARFSSGIVMYIVVGTTVDHFNRHSKVSTAPECGAR
jgi:hypothetical protein